MLKKSVLEVREVAHLGRRLLEEARNHRLRRNLIPLTIGGATKFAVRMTGQRRFQAYCVGAPRTGTNSAAAAFRDSFRARHEADSEVVLEIALDFLDGKVERQALHDFIRKRDQIMFLEMESSSHNIYLVPELVGLFPAAKFLVPIRDPEAWLKSYIDYIIGMKKTGGPPNKNVQRRRMEKLRYGELWEEYGPGEETLERYGMPSIAAFLSFYCNHYQFLFDSIPEDRYYCYNTRSFNDELRRICSFLGLEESSVSSSQTHTHKSKRTYGVLEEVDPQHLRRCLDRYWFQSNLAERAGHLF